MSGRTNLVLGGAGVIGRALSRALRAAGEPVESVDLVEGFDLRTHDPPTPPGTFVWFLAWDSGGAKHIYDPAAQDAILAGNTALSERVFGWLERRRVPFLFTTTQLAGEAHAYGRSKAAADVRTRALGGRLARLWNVYDAEPPGRRSHVIPDLIAGARARGAVQLATRGLERRQFIHADDCAAALVRLRETDLREADVTSGEWTEVRDVAGRIAALLGVPLQTGARDGVESLVEPRTPLPGWTPRIGLDDGLARVIAMMRARGWDASIDS